MTRLPHLALAFTIFGAVATQNTTAVAEIGPKETHFVAIGVCPPWKKADNNPDLSAKWAASCRNDVNLMTEALKKTLPLEDGDITKLIDEQASYQAVISALTELQKKADKNDRVIIYLNTHGGELNTSYKGNDVMDEVFALYTETEPADFYQASINGPWMSARTLRDMVDDIKAEEIVLIFESCHAGASYDDFRYNIAGRYKEGWKGREAIIYSARGDQVANFDEGNDRALFTKTFADILTSQEQKTLGDAFEKASIETHRNIRKRCLQGAKTKQADISHNEYLTYCTQEPMSFDPYGLLDDIGLLHNSESAMR